MQLAALCEEGSFGREISPSLDSEVRSTMAEDQEIVAVSANATAEPIALEIPLGDAVSKRQRRPNVRLNEIGDRPLANVLEYFLKRKGGRNISSKSANAGARRQFSVKREPAAVKVKNEDGHSAAGRGEVGLPRAPRTRPLNLLEKSNYAQNGGSPANVKARYSGAIPSPGKGEGLMRNRFLNRKDKLGKRRHADHGVMVPSKRPGNARVHAYEEGSWRVPAVNEIGQSLEANREDANGLEHRTSGTNDRVQSKNHVDLQEDFEVNHAGSSFESDSRDSFRNASGIVARDLMPNTMIREKGNFTARDPEKQDPSNMELHEDLRVQVPLWERGIAPLENKVRDWLQGLGLEKYSFLLQLHEVGSDVLPLLTMDDLKEIGITAVGARRKLFSEIRKLRQRLILVEDSSFDEK